MPTIPCQQKVDCLCTDNPFRNLSSEAPDRFFYIGYYWGNAQHPQRPGYIYSAQGCPPFTAHSAISQEDADLEAQLQFFESTCMTPEPCTENCDGQPPVEVFYNEAQTVAAFCPDGTPFYYTVAAGRFNAPSLSLANQMALSYATQLANNQKVCIGSIAGRACMGVAYGETIATTGRSLPVVTTLYSGTLPPGITLSNPSSTTARLSGTCNTPDSYTFTLKATDGFGNYMLKTYTIYVMGCTNANPLPSGSVGAAYAELLVGAGGVAPYTFEVSSGSLPDGVTLGTDGQFAGTPTTAETQDFTIRITDDTARSCEVPYSIEVTGGCPALVGTFAAGAITRGYAAVNNTSAGRVLALSEFAHVRLYNRETHALLAAIAQTSGPLEILPVRRTAAPDIYDFYVCAGTIGFAYIQAIDGLTHVAIGQWDDGVTFDQAWGLTYISSLNRVFAFRNNSGTACVDFVWINAAHPPALLGVDPGLDPAENYQCAAYSVTSDWLYKGARYTVGPINRVVGNFMGGAGTVFIDTGTYYIRTMCWVPETNEIWFTADSGLNYRIGVIDCATNTLAWINTPETGVGRSIAADGAGHVAVVGSTTLDIHIYDTASRTLVCTVTGSGGGYEDIDWDDGGRIYAPRIGTVSVDYFQ